MHIMHMLIMLIMHRPMGRNDFRYASKGDLGD